MLGEVGGVCRRVCAGQGGGGGEGAAEPVGRYYLSDVPPPPLSPGGCLWFLLSCRAQPPPPPPPLLPPLQAVASGFFFHAARKDPQEGYKTIVEHQPVYIHPSSSVFQQQPDWVSDRGTKGRAGREDGNGRPGGRGRGACSFATPSKIKCPLLIPLAGHLPRAGAHHQRVHA